MRVVHIIRHKNPRFYSIENVFENIRRAWPFPDVPEVFMLPRSGFSIINIIALIRLRLRRRNSLFHITGDVHYGALFLPRRRTLLTIHDCVFVNSYSGLKGWIIRMLYLKLPVAYLGHLTAVSDKTRNEVVTFTGCRASKVSVVGNPVTDGIRFVGKEFEKDNPAVLFIGTTPNKNLERVSLALKDIPCTLLIIGNLTNAQESLLKASGLRYFAMSGLSNAKMADLFAEADIVLYPSLYEGFGLPVIEGFVSGRIVVTSDISPLKEIAADAAILVDPFSVESIRNGVLSAIHNSELRDQLIKNGLREAKKYHASKIAKDYVNLYHKIESEYKYNA